jgi:ribosomal protein S17E
LNKVRKLAEDLVANHPALFSRDFEVNKAGVDRVLIVRNRALRNQIAGTITVIMKERTPEIEEESAIASVGESTLESRTAAAESTLEDPTSSQAGARELPIAAAQQNQQQKGEQEEIQQSAV